MKTTQILYYSEEELFGKIESWNQFETYMSGWKSGIIREEGVDYFRAKYVDIYLERNNR